MPNYYKALVLYIFFHELLLCITITNVQMYHFNNLLNMMIMLLSVSVIAPAIDLDKFIKSTYIIGAVLSLGILYQFRQLLSGSPISPIPVPVVDWFFERGRADIITIRPMSFFEEPSSYANYMLIPMYFLLRSKKYIWYAVCVGFILMSTSTTGVFGSFALLGFDALLNIKNKGQLVLIAVLIGIAAYGLTSVELFSNTIDKIEKTDASENSRTSNGPNLVKAIPSGELILGINASNLQDYLKEHRELYGKIRTFGDSDVFFVSGFWSILFKFGIVGFILYYFVYIRLIKEDLRLLPLLGTELLAAFFGGLGFSSLFVFVITAAVVCVFYDCGKYYSKILK